MLRTDLCDDNEQHKQHSMTKRFKDVADVLDDRVGLAGAPLQDPENVGDHAGSEPASRCIRTAKARNPSLIEGTLPLPYLRNMFAEIT